MNYKFKGLLRYRAHLRFYVTKISRRADLTCFTTEKVVVYLMMFLQQVLFSVAIRKHDVVLALLPMVKKKKDTAINILSFQ